MSSTGPGPATFGAIKIATLDEEDMDALKQNIFPEITALIKAGKVGVSDGELWCMQSDHETIETIKNIGE